jgi:hypothetical protein
MSGMLENKSRTLLLNVWEYCRFYSSRKPSRNTRKKGIENVLQNHRSNSFLFKTIHLITFLKSKQTFICKNNIQLYIFTIFCSFKEKKSNYDLTPYSPLITRPMRSRRTSLVPAPISYNFASRKRRLVG